MSLEDAVTIFTGLVGLLAVLVGNHEIKEIKKRLSRVEWKFTATEEPDDNGD